jgi:TetR/AcrR family transcriptional regulator, fatty acid metabolism regulator protein
MKKKNNDITHLRRTQLTRATYQVVSKKGYYNFTIRDIANEAGLSTGLVHYYFKDKDELLLTLLKEMNSNLRNFLTKELEHKDDPADKLLTFIDQAFELVEREKDYFYVIIDFWTQVNHNPRISKANARLYQSYRDECAAMLTEGVKKGIFVDMDIHYTATMIISIVQGLIIQFILDKEAFHYQAYTTKVKEQVLAMVKK